MTTNNTTTIPAGYRLTIESWENDGDYRKTRVVEGLSKSAAEFVVKLCKLHYCQNACWRDETGFGNMYDPSKDEINVYLEALDTLLQEHLNTGGDLPCDWITDSDAVFEYTEDLFGYGESVYTRVFEEVKVEYVPQDIVLEDCTADFV